MVASSEVNTPSGAHVIHDENGAVFGTQPAYLLPEAVGRHDVVKEIAVHIRLAYDRRNFSLVFFKGFAYPVDIVPVKVDVVHYILFDDARIVDFLAPRRDTVIIAPEEDYFLAVGIGACAHDRRACHVISVFCEERPVGALDGIDQQIRKIDHYR